jgi:type II pantothenate kinase
MIIGIDIGGTTTNVIGYDGNTIIHPVTVTADDPLASGAGALGKFLKENNLGLSDVKRIALTGVGSGSIQNELFGLPVSHIGEFEAIGRGGAFLAQIPKAVVVSMGTGTAIVEVNDGTISHWGGTGVGGGTVVGLSKYILGITNIDILCKRAATGRLNQIDLTVGDISSSEMTGLSDSLTASNFGRYGDDANEADLALAIFNLVYQTIAVTSNGAAKATRNRTVILTGRLATVPHAKNIFNNLSDLFGITFHIPKLAEYATAVGASLAAEPSEPLSGRRIHMDKQGDTVMKKILLIEDDELVRNMMKRILEIAGYDVETASDGREGVERFTQNGADLVITDLIMPEQDGIETIIELQKIVPEIRIIAVSGGGRIGPGKIDAMDYLNIAKSFGAFQILPKPVEREELLDAIEKALNAEGPSPPDETQTP